MDDVFLVPGLKRAEIEKYVNAKSLTLRKFSIAEEELDATLEQIVPNCT
jgi:hypothetical protein